MKRSIVGSLIRKDLFLYRWLIGGTILVGLASLVLSGVGGSLGTTGGILLLTSLVVLGAFLAIHSAITERQTRSLLFVLSLPISPMQYTAAKVVGALIAFLVPWALFALVIALFGGGTDAGAPPLPVTLTLLGLLLANFCVLTAIGVSTGSEFWSVAGIIATNTTVPVFMTAAMPALTASTLSAGSPWTGPVLATLGAEFAVAALALGLAFHVQSRRTDFV